MGLFSKLKGAAEQAVAGSLTPDIPVRLCGNQRVSVVGESHYQDALRAAAGGRTVDPGDVKGAVEVQAVLVPEPSNRFDRNAVRVDVGGRTVGYLPKEIAGQYQPLLIEMARGAEYGWCSGRIMGGGRRSYGIHLCLGTPSRLRFANSCDEFHLLDADKWVTVTGFDGESVAGMAVDEHGMLPPLAAELAVGEIAKGKYAGQPCVEVKLEGRVVGSFTGKMSERYLPAVRRVMDAGRRPGCELVVRRQDGKVTCSALMPE